MLKKKCKKTELETSWQTIICRCDWVLPYASSRWAQMHRQLPDSPPKPETTPRKMVKSNVQGPQQASSKHDWSTLKSLFS